MMMMNGTLRDESDWGRNATGDDERRKETMMIMMKQKK